MLGSHDSYTFLKARNPIINLIKGLWKCLTKDIQQQYIQGVRFFDIRVFKDKGTWRTGHGLAEFQQDFNSIEDICKLFLEMPGCLFSIWLEKGSEEDWEQFSIECNQVKDKYPSFVEAYRKKGEVKLFQKVYPKKIFYTCPMSNWKNFTKLPNPILYYANRNNPIITKEMIEDTSVIYFMDLI